MANETKIKKYRIADAHTHIYPEKIAEKATSSVSNFYDIEMDVSSGTVSALLESGKSIGVEKYLVCSVATKLEQVASINNFIASACKEHSELFGLAAYHIDESDPLAAINALSELDLKGIKIHPDFQRFNIDDPRMIEVFKLVDKAGLLALVHMGDSRYDYSHPRRLFNVLREIPTLRVLASHFGGWSVWNDAKEMLGAHVNEFPNLYFDSSSSLPFIDRDIARDLVYSYGTDRVMFGTDFPMWKHDVELERFLNLGFSEAENAQMLYGNFARFFS